MFVARPSSENILSLPTICSIAMYIIQLFDFAFEPVELKRTSYDRSRCKENDVILLLINITLKCVISRREYVLVSNIQMISSDYSKYRPSGE